MSLLQINIGPFFLEQLQRQARNNEKKTALKYEQKSLMNSELNFRRITEIVKKEISTTICEAYNLIR